MVIRRKKLVGFTDSKRAATARVKSVKKDGATGVTVKKEFGGYSVMAFVKRKKR